VENTYTIKEAQSHFPSLVKEAEAGDSMVITRHGKTVAYMISAERMEALAETLQILSDEKAMKAIREAQGGRTKFHSVDSLPG
jgi:prevent-host-death family protein